MVGLNIHIYMHMSAMQGGGGGAAYFRRGRISRTLRYIHAHERNAVPLVWGSVFPDLGNIPRFREFDSSLGIRKSFSKITISIGNCREQSGIKCQYHTSHASLGKLCKIESKITKEVMTLDSGNTGGAHSGSP